MRLAANAQYSAIAVLEEATYTSLFGGYLRSPSGLQRYNLFPKERDALSVRYVEGFNAHGWPQELELAPVPPAGSPFAVLADRQVKLPACRLLQGTGSLYGMLLAVAAMP